MEHCTLSALPDGTLIAVLTVCEKFSLVSLSWPSACALAWSANWLTDGGNSLKRTAWQQRRKDSDNQPVMSEA